MERELKKCYHSEKVIAKSTIIEKVQKKV